MKYLFLLLPLFCFCQETPPAPAQTNTVAAVAKSDKSVIVIDVKARAADFMQAFELLRRDKQTAKIAIRTSMGMLTEVSDLSLSKNSSLFFIKVLTNQGMKYHIVPVEDVIEVSYFP